jgi:N-acetyltransferase
MPKKGSDPFSAQKKGSDPFSAADALENGSDPFSASVKNGSDPFFDLRGRCVRLVPLCAGHLPDLTAAGADPAIWQWFSLHAGTPEGMRAFVEDALAMQRAGTGVPFSVVEAASGAVVGSTRFGAIERKHRRAEIGWTWLAPCAQRTGVNTETKYLMLRHAFEEWGLQRVEFKTDSLNDKSRSALKRIGATEEGTLRNHMVTWSGRVRHTVYYSITDGDWPRVKLCFEDVLLAGRPSVAGAAPDTAGMGMPAYAGPRA